MDTWVTSDHHFAHANVIKYADRPFASIEEHDAALIREWNAVVKPEDRVFYLGDFTLAGTQVARQIFAKLNGVVHLLTNLWHHDCRWIKGTPTINQDNLMVKVLLQSPIVVLEPDEAKTSFPIVLCHYPFEVWDRKHYGAVHFHGHSHGNLPRINNRLDVGVDMAKQLVGKYRPFSLHEAISLAIGYHVAAVEV